MNALKRVFISLGILFVVIVAIGILVDPGKTSTVQTPVAKPSPTSQPSKTDLVLQQREAKFGKRPEVSAWDGSYRAVKTYLEKNANDPDSIKFAGCGEVKVDESEGWLVGCKWRGKNSFGGVVTNFNWFIIKNEQVINMLSHEAYSLQQ